MCCCLALPFISAEDILLRHLYNIAILPSLYISLVPVIFDLTRSTFFHLAWRLITIHIHDSIVRLSIQSSHHRQQLSRKVFPPPPICR